MFSVIREFDDFHEFDEKCSQLFLPSSSHQITISCSIHLFSIPIASFFSVLGLSGRNFIASLITAEGGTVDELALGRCHLPICYTRCDNQSVLEWGNTTPIVHTITSLTYSVGRGHGNCSRSKFCCCI